MPPGQRANSMQAEDPVPRVQEKTPAGPWGAQAVIPAGFDDLCDESEAAAEPAPVPMPASALARGGRRPTGVSSRRKRFATCRLQAHELDKDSLCSQAQRRRLKSATSQVFKRLIRAEALPDGPVDLQQLGAFPLRVYQMIQAAAPQLASRLQQAVSGGLVLTTSYSGMGCPEAAATMLEHSVRSGSASNGAGRSGFRHYSACEVIP